MTLSIFDWIRSHVCNSMILTVGFSMVAETGADSFVHKGVEFEKTIDLSLGQLFLMMLKIHDKKVLQIDADTGEELTGTVILNKSILLAKWLKSKGLGPGDCISIWSENSLDFCIIPVGCFLAGVTLAPINYEYTKGEAKLVINLSKPKFIFCSPRTVNQMISEKSNFPFLKKVVLFGKNRINHKDVEMFQDIVGGASSDEIDESFSATEVDPEECVAVVLCSSGTTGLPKGVMTTHANITSLIEILRLVWADSDSSLDNKIMTGVSPFFHGMGFMVMTLNLLIGSVMIVYTHFNPKQFLESIQKYKVNMITVAPPVLLLLNKHPMVKDYDLSSVTEVRSGAAPIGKDLERGVLERLKLNKISQNYGMTETTLTVLAPYGEKTHKYGSVGKIVPGMSCKVVDEEGNALGPFKSGEICFKGPLIMKGYINNPEATAQVFDSDNWLHTGDVAYYDEDKDFYIVDRIKELIKYKGFQVAPAELEAILGTHPAVADAAVVGVDDERSGELPFAFIVKKANQSVTAKEIQKFMSEQVSPSKQLRGGITFIKEIPRNPSGKILRRVLREIANKTPSKL